MRREHVRALRAEEPPKAVLPVLRNLGDRDQLAAAREPIPQLPNGLVAAEGAFAPADRAERRRDRLLVPGDDSGRADEGGSTRSMAARDGACAFDLDLAERAAVLGHGGTQAPAERFVIEVAFRHEADVLEAARLARNERRQVPHLADGIEAAALREPPHGRVLAGVDDEALPQRGA